MFLLSQILFLFWVATLLKRKYFKSNFTHIKHVTFDIILLLKLRRRQEENFTHLTRIYIALFFLMQASLYSIHVLAERFLNRKSVRIKTRSISPSLFLFARRSSPVNRLFASDVGVKQKSFESFKGF